MTISEAIEMLDGLIRQFGDGVDRSALNRIENELKGGKVKPTIADIILAWFQSQLRISLDLLWMLVICVALMIANDFLDRVYIFIDSEIAVNQKMEQYYTPTAQILTPPQTIYTNRVNK